MLLSDLGADVVRIDRHDPRPASPGNVTTRGRRSVALDLKSAQDLETCLKLVEAADALIEGFRPGVMERLGLGPEVVHARNPKLTYGRMTGWGQTGPYAHAAGHDINYISISGALHAIGTQEKPIPPLNLVGDYGGGALYLAFGLLAGVLNARETGRGQVIDCAMSDGAASLMAMFYGVHASGTWQAEAREANMLDGGAHYYGTYRCRDGEWISIGPIEPQFYALLLEKLGFDPKSLPDQNDRAQWPQMRSRFAEAFAQKTQGEWCEVLAGTDVCFGPVLSMADAPKHPHNAARQTFVEVAGVLQPGPAPRFSETPGAIQRPPVQAGEHTQEVLAEWLNRR
jgi:alpha-methylacyl-CoA racemase